MLEQLCPSAGPSCLLYVGGTEPVLVLCSPAQNRHRSSASSQRAQGICVALVQHRPSVFDAGPALYRCCADVLSLLDYDVIPFNEHNTNYAFFYLIMYAYFNLGNFIMYRPYVFFYSYYMHCNNYCIEYFINKKKKNQFR